LLLLLLVVVVVVVVVQSLSVTEAVHYVVERVVENKRLGITGQMLGRCWAMMIA